ncbi:hypothetical protein L3Q82_020369 [Scortum barcoo]|uniref:Uncharacterized protein n=1 Tax=Scortum barcoo TaxID=214431 RepID=A0ACB8V7K7_9TELE|nr:hypothetical protein L3Q82_020369 [Scortum barcoo]
MLEQVCQSLGMPKELRTDNGTHFRNAQVDQWCQQNGVIRIYSPPYTPQANGVVERTIGLVKNWIGKNANTKEWSTKGPRGGCPKKNDIGVAEEKPGLWAGGQRTEAKREEIKDCAKRGFLSDEKEVIQWKEVKNTCVVCSRPSTLTVQWEGPGSEKDRSKADGAKSELKEQIYTTNR